MFKGNPWFSVGVLQKACPHIFNHGHSCKQEVRRNVIMYSTFNFNDSLLIIRSPPLSQENAQMTIQTTCKIYLSQLTQVRDTAWKIYRVIEPCFRVFKCKSMLKSSLWRRDFAILLPSTSRGNSNNLTYFRRTLPLRYLLMMKLYKFCISFVSISSSKKAKLFLETDWKNDQLAGKRASDIFQQ